LAIGFRRVCVVCAEQIVQVGWHVRRLRVVRWLIKSNPTVRRGMQCLRTGEDVPLLGVRLFGL